MPEGIPIGFGLGNLAELERQRDQICAEDPDNSPSLAEISEAFKDQASAVINGGQLQNQPANVALLLNKETYFSSTAASHSAALNVAGHSISIKLTPTSYHWDFGDGEEQKTASAGGIWPDGQVRHAYQRSGTYQPAVTVTWSAIAQLPSGSWVPVPGIGYTRVLGQELVVNEARAVLTYNSR
ncbi:PKD domain-containing protein [Arcanobacterium pinnipediorum]|uniref:PKD domain-containing protein n=1 Tax=Arcanobacterium pinnipediorum TaxID=1503041 RepID=A0ABY5AJB8_9ACTO|nr:PKD domain-containing protein [Arcanobacterium pinnipediorum]USR80061.1 PKD domain-containing protein [Arcanobacterium pinnipediorum]